MSDRCILCVITGMPHSGTTYLTKVLSSTPDIMSGFECGILLDDVQNYPNVLPWYHWMQDSADTGQWGIPPEHMAHICNAQDHIAAYGLIKKYAAGIGSSRIKQCFVDAKYIIDKTPAYIYQLDEVMGRVDLPFIVIQKGIDHQYRSFKKRGLSIRYFILDYLKAVRGLKKAQKRYRDRILVIRQQELVADKDATLERIYDFLGLPHDPHSSLELFFEKTGFNKKIYESSVGGVRDEPMQKNSGLKLSRKESGILRAIEFAQSHLPAFAIGLGISAMNMVLSAKRLLRS